MTATISPRAGKQVDAAMLENIPRLVTTYFSGKPDPAMPAQRVAFGTSGHRGSAFDNGFNENHILAISQALCQYRREQRIDGPLFIGMDTHALSEPAFVSAIEVLVANGVDVRIDSNGGYTPTPVISHAILQYNSGRTNGLADGIVISPSHNPPSDGGFKYNPPNGGPAATEVTDRVQGLANDMLEKHLDGVRRIPYERARKAPQVQKHDYVGAYVADLANIVDMDAIRAAKIRIGIDPLGGAAVHFWAPIIDRYGIDATVVNPAVDPTFRFMTADWDGKIRMDCSSPYAMARLIEMRDQFDIAFANDTDADRHGIVTRSNGLMNPNHYLTAAISYLFANRPDWPAGAAIGKTMVSSSSIDRVARQLGRPMFETPVGFKWFVEGLSNGALGFAGEESAGASFLRRDGTAWSTDKDGLILGLLAAEITARTGRDPAEIYDRLTADLGCPLYERIDAPATPRQKDILKKLSPEQVTSATLAGEPIEAKLTAAPGDGQPIGGLKVVAKSGWFAARPSGTENVYKIYAESFRDADHLHLIQQEAQAMVAAAFQQAGS